MTRRVSPIVVAILLALALPRLWPHAKLRDQIPLSTAIWSQDNQLLHVTLASDDQYRLWAPLSEISPAITEAFELKEDRWFYWHPGVNPIALARAAFRTHHGDGRQGGSTITMQLARLLYHLNTKTPRGKLRQTVEALWLEARYSKHDLLEAYLNLVPFGGNLQGVTVASRVNFGKPPKNITLSEALALAVIPQRPQARSFLAARTRLGKLWLASNHPTDSDRRQLELPLTISQRFALPRVAPHFVDALLADGVRQSRFDSTLDSGLQRLVERQIAIYIRQAGDRGISNAAALLVDTRDMGVKAWVGSADYDNVAIHGQVNGVLARRSPGSTLKPFVYALALDQGVLHPQTMLRDAPTSFGPFTPENFDGRFFGPIAAQDALIRSRNIPAVWVATQLRQPDLYQFLRTAGIGLTRPDSYYGLALALGGGEVSMEELAGLYASLANGGMLRPLRTAVNTKQNSDRGEDRQPAGQPILSPEAAFITLDMLNRNPRPDDDGTGEARGRWPIAWKTGTSWGFRDAWSAGIVGPWVLVVWIGDFDAQGNPAFVGVDAAAPLFFRITDALNLERPAESLPIRTPPPGVKRVAVCAESGDLPNADCPHTVDTWYIPGKSPIRVSRLHRAVAIDTRTNQPACAPYALETTRFEVFENWSSEMLRLFREAGMPRRAPPALSDCASDDAGNSTEDPRIVSPLRGVTYSLRNSTTHETISLESETAAGVQAVFWFDGSALIGKAKVADGPLAWHPAKGGYHLLRLIDDRGRSADRDVEIHLGP